MKSPNDLDDAQGRAAERVGIAGAGLFFANREEAGKLVDLVSERNGARGVIELIVRHRTNQLRHPRA